MEAGKENMLSIMVMVFLAMAIMSGCQSMSSFSPLDPEAVDVAMDFAQALVAGEFERANSLLVSEIRSILTPEQLRLDYEGMIAYTSNPSGLSSTLSLR